MTNDKDQEGMSADRTILSDSFFFDKLGEHGFFGTTEAAVIAQPFVTCIEEIAESHMSAHFRSTVKCCLHCLRLRCVVKWKESAHV